MKTALIMPGYFKSFKSLAVYAMLILSVNLFCCCTRNNGDIGPWFGSWQLTEIEIDGAKVSSYGENIFWAFQNDVFSMKYVYPNDPGHSVDDRWGTWEESGDAIKLNFTHSDDSYAPGTGIYAPLKETGIPANEVSTLVIIKKPGTKAVLSYTDSAGKIYTYHLIKR